MLPDARYSPNNNNQNMGEEYVGSRLVGRLRKRWIDSVNECLKKRGLNVGRASRMVYYRNECRGFELLQLWLSRLNETLRMEVCPLLSL